MRYMDFSKFEDLFESQELYFRRADKLPDALEGTLSVEGVHGTSASDIAFSERVSLDRPSYERQLEYRKTAKGCTFLNCWHINTRETKRMWDAYTESNDSVLIVSTAERLQASLKSRVFISPVQYVSPETPRTEFDEKSLFFFKDISFSFEQEYRLLINLSMLGGFIREEHPDDFYRRVPVDLSTLVAAIQPHPSASDETVRKIGALVKKHLPTAIPGDRARHSAAALA